MNKQNDYPVKCYRGETGKEEGSECWGRYGDAQLTEGPGKCLWKPAPELRAGRGACPGQSFQGRRGGVSSLFEDRQD